MMEVRFGGKGVHNLLAPPQVCAEPLQSFVKTVTRSSTGRLDILHKFSLVSKNWMEKTSMKITYPSPLSQAVQTKFISNLGSIHCVLLVKNGLVSEPPSKCTQRQETHRQILFVGEDQEQGIPKLILIQHSLKLLTSLADTLSVVGVDNENDSLGVLEVMAPKGTDLVLTTDIPHGEGNVLVLDSLDVEAYCGREV